MRSGACLLQHMSTAEPSSARGRATSTLLPVIVALILLPAIALASPPDPSWIAGMYDGGDGDEIVILVYETPAALLLPSTASSQLRTSPRSSTSAAVVNAPVHGAPLRKIVPRRSLQNRR